MNDLVIPLEMILDTRPFNEMKKLEMFFKEGIHLECPRRKMVKNSIGKIENNFKNNYMD